MQRGVGLFALAVVLAAIGVASARAAGSETTTTGTGTTSTTTTATTTATTSTATATTTTETTTTTTAPTSTTTPATPTATAGTTTSRNVIAKKTPKQRRKHRHRQPMRPPPDYPVLPYPFLPGGALAPVVENNAVVSIAMQYLGVRYTWGGATPKTGFDCSGLVEYVFAQLGVSLPHNAAAQYYSPDAVWIPPNRLQAGDLVFFTGADGTRNAPGHVGIYVADGYIIDAPHTGAFVRIDSLNARWFANRYAGAKRIIGASLHARLLLHATEHRSVLVGRLLLPQQAGPASGGALPLLAALPTAAHASEPRSYRLELGTGAALGGGLLLLFIAGAVAYGRRRRAPGAEPGTDNSS